MAEPVVLLKDEGTDVNGERHLWFFCPGCQCSHAYTVPRWTWNGSFEKPTFHPSLLCNKDDPARRCHLWIKDGVIEFLNDQCHHVLRGKVPMEPFQW